MIFNAVEIEINHACNRSCSYCPNNVLERKEKGEMSIEVYATLLSQLKEINFSGRISYDFYNEPLLCSKLVFFVELAKQYLPECQIELYSNGTLLTIARFKQLFIAGVDHFVVTKHEGERAHTFANTFILLDGEERKRVTYRDHGEITKTNRGGLLKQLAYDDLLKKQPCMIPSMMLTVTLEGNVVPCFEDFQQLNQMGNIMEKNIREIWFQKKYVQFRKALLMGERCHYEACNQCSRTQVLGGT